MRYGHGRAGQWRFVEHEQRRGKIGDAPPGIFFHAAHDERTYRERQVGRQRRPIGLSHQDGGQRIRVTVWTRQKPAGQSASRYSTHPNAQTSVRLSTAFPSLLGRHVGGRAEDHARGASGRRRRRRRRPTARVRRRCWPSALARPKSSTFTVPSGATLMLAGLRSRWMMPCSCAASRASAIWRAMAGLVGRESAPRRCARRASAPRPVP